MLPARVYTYFLRRPLPVGAVTAVAVAIALRMVWGCLAPRTSECEAAVHAGNHRGAVAICLASYERTKADGDLRWAAKAHLYLDEMDTAEALTQRFRNGPLWGDAQAILSFAALRREQPREAFLHAALALLAHVLANDELGQANDAVLISQAAWRRGDLATALNSADLALAIATSLGDPRREVAAHLARGEALCVLADPIGATAAFTAAVRRATTPCDLAWARLKLGRCEVEIGESGVGLHDLDEALEANRECGAPNISTAIYAIQAWQLRARDPAGALALLDKIAGSGPDDLDSLILRGLIAADRGAFDDAESYFALAADFNPPNVDWSWEIPRFRGELSEMRNGPRADLEAERYYQSSTALIQALRPAARAHSAFLISNHRGSYDDLIALYARAHRWRSAFAAVLELDASDMLRATAAATEMHSTRPLDTPPLPDPMIASQRMDLDDVLAAWRSRDLVIVMAQSPRRIGRGRERVIRMRILDGRVTGTDVGDANAATRWADALFADPGDRDAGRSLGKLIVPAGSGDRRPLYVLAIGALGKVPLAALRDEDDALVIARRPLVRVLALRTTNPESHAAGRAVVIADPRGNLPDARAEGDLVAAAVGGVHAFGAMPPLRATCERLFAASDAELLHVAAHVQGRGWWRSLQLADCEVEPAEIVRRHLAPRIAVLASCGSAAAMDEEGWGSIASALLEAGTPAVIATDRAIRDGAAQTVMTAFYAQPDWRTDPARALARVQTALEADPASSGTRASAASTWSAFSVLGRPPDAAAAMPSSH